MSEPRGLRNNNPGNIKQSPTQYEGEKIPSSDSVFKQFKTMAYGYRAIFVLLRYYIRRLQLDTITKIFKRYEPVEFKLYIDHVVKETGISANKRIAPDDWKSLAKIVAAISSMENGRTANANDLMKGLSLAKGESVPEVPKKASGIGLLFGLGIAMYALSLPEQREGR